MGVLSNEHVEWKSYHGDQDLNIDDVNIFKFSVDQVYDQIASAYTEILAENERIKADRFLHIGDKKRFIVSKYMLRNLLSKFTGIPPAAIRFELANHKKPFIKAGIEFNTTHSRNMVLIAITRKTVGIDVEFINKDFDYTNIISTVFNKNEQLFLNSTLNRLTAFYLLWTRKEAILKAVGEGLTEELKMIDTLQPIVTRHMFSFHVKSLWIDENYVMSLATQNKNDQFYYWNYE